MTAATDPHTDAPTEPQQVLYLTKAGLRTREIGRMLNLSQSTVVRRLREGSQAEVSEQARRRWMTLMFILLTLSAMVIAAAMATNAWAR